MISFLLAKSIEGTLKTRNQFCVSECPGLPIFHGPENRYGKRVKEQEEGKKNESGVCVASVGRIETRSSVMTNGSLFLNGLNKCNQSNQLISEIGVISLGHWVHKISFQLWELSL